MKRAAILFTAAVLMLSMQVACTNPPSGGSPDVSAASPAESEPGGSSLNSLGDGVNVKYTVRSEAAEILITGCPSYGDKKSPFVYGELVNGSSADYELVCIIIVGSYYYGKKPYNNSPHSFIKSDNSFVVQFSSNDGQGTDWNASSIFLYLVPTGYKDNINPDAGAGYVVPPEQVNELEKDSVCVVQIDREVVVE